MSSQRAPLANLLLIPSSYAPKIGGLETATRQLALELARRGVRVTVLTNRYPRSLTSFEEIDKLSVHRILMPDILPHKTQLVRFPKYIFDVLVAPFQMRRVAQFVNKVKPDIVNPHYLGTPALYASAVKTLHPGTKLVHSIHGSDLPNVPYPTGSWRVAQWELNRADAVTTCSQEMSRHVFAMRAAATQKIFVTWNGIDPSEFEGVPPYQHYRPYTAFS